jgi:import inner membrane translocase subunit TIM23
VTIPNLFFIFHLLPAGLKKCALGGGIGLGLSAIYVLYSLTGGSTKKFKELRQQYI